MIGAAQVQPEDHHRHLWSFLREYTRQLSLRLDQDISPSVLQACVAVASQATQYEIVDLTQEEEGEEEESSLGTSTVDDEAEAANEEDEANDPDLAPLLAELVHANGTLQTIQTELDAPLHEQRNVAERQAEVNAAALNLRRAKGALQTATSAMDAANESRHQSAITQARNVAAAEKALEDVRTAKRRRLADQAAMRRKRRSQTGIFLSDRHPQSSKVWAVERLLELARIAPADSMAILRYILSRIHPASKLTTETDSLTVPEDLSNLDIAITYAKESVTQQDVQMLARCMHVAIQYRLTTRAETIGDRSAEDAAHWLLEKRNAHSLKTIGMRVLYLAWAISPRSMFGVLLLPFLGLNATVLQTIPQDHLIALMGLFVTCDVASSEQRLSIPRLYAQVVDVITHHIVPAMELAFLRNLRQVYDRFSDDVKAIIARPGDTIAEFELENPHRFAFVMHRSTRTRRSSIQLNMPTAHLLDSRYKALSPNSPTPDLISVYDGRVRLTLAKHMQLEDKHRIDATAFDKLKAYSHFWNLRWVEPISDDVYPGRTANPEPDVLNTVEWEGLHPTLAYWAVYLTTDGPRVSTSFAGVLTSTRIANECRRDAQLHHPIVSMSPAAWAAQ